MLMTNQPWDWLLEGQNHNMFIFPFFNAVIAQTGRFAEGILTDTYFIEQQFNEAFELSTTVPKLTFYGTETVGWNVTEDSFVGISDDIISDVIYLKRSSQIILLTSPTNGSYVQVQFMNSESYDVESTLQIDDSSHSVADLTATGKIAVNNDESLLAILVGAQVILVNLTNNSEIARKTVIGGSNANPRNIKFINDDNDILAIGSSNTGTHTVMLSLDLEDSLIYGDLSLDFNQFAYSRNEKTLITSGSNGYQIYNSEGGVYNLLPIILPDAPNNIANVMCFSPDDTTLVIATSGQLHLYETENWTKLPPPIIQPSGTVHSISFSPNGAECAVTTGTNTRIYDTGNWYSFELESNSGGNKFKTEYKDLRDYVNDGVADGGVHVTLRDNSFIFDEEFQIAIWGRSKPYTIFDTKFKDYKELTRLPSNGSNTSGSAAYNPINDTYLCSKGLGYLSMVDSNGIELDTLDTPGNDPISDIEFNQEYSLIYFKKGNAVHVADALTFNLIETFVTVTGDMFLTSDNSRIVVGQNIYNISGTLLGTLSYTPNKSLTKSVRVADGVLEVYDIDSYNETLASEQPSAMPAGTIYGYNFSDDDSLFAVTCSGAPNNLIIYETENWTAIHSAFIASNNILEPIFYPSNNKVYILDAPSSTGSTYSVRLFNLVNNSLEEFALGTNSGTYNYRSTKMLSRYDNFVFVTLEDSYDILDIAENEFIDTYSVLGDTTTLNLFAATGTTPDQLYVYEANNDGTFSKIPFGDTPKIVGNNGLGLYITPSNKIFYSGTFSGVSIPSGNPPVQCLEIVNNELKYITHDIFPSDIIASTDLMPRKKVASIDLTHDETYMCVGFESASSTEGIQILKKIDGIYEPLTRLNTGYAGNKPIGVWSNSGEYLVTRWTQSNNSRPLKMYKRDGDIFTEIAVSGFDFNITPELKQISWSPNDRYMAIVSSTSGRPLIIFERDGDNFTRIPDIFNFSAYPLSCQFSSDGKYLVCLENASPYIHWWKLDGDDFIKLDAPIDEPPRADSGSIALFNHNCTQLYVLWYGSPYPSIAIYDIIDDELIKVTDSDVYDGFGSDAFAGYMAFATNSLLSPPPDNIVSNEFTDTYSIEQNLGTVFATSLEYVEIEIPANASEATYTFNTPLTDMDRAFSIFAGWGTEDVSAGPVMFPRFEIISNTQAKAIRLGAAQYASRICMYVIQGTSSLVNSVQRGVVSLGPNITDATATLANPVNTNNSVVTYQGYTDGNALNTTWSDRLPILDGLIDSTTVKAFAHSSPGTQEVGFECIEFNSSAITSIQKITHREVAATEKTYTINQIDKSKSLLFFGGTTASHINRIATSEIIDNTTVFIETFSGTPETAHSANVTVVEFDGFVLASETMPNSNHWDNPPWDGTGFPGFRSIYWQHGNNLVEEVLTTAGFTEADSISMYNGLTVISSSNNNSYLGYNGYLIASKINSSGNMEVSRMVSAGQNLGFRPINHVAKLKIN